MLVLDDPGERSLPVSVVHHGIALEIGHVQHLRLEADGTVSQRAAAIPKVSIDGASVDHPVRQAVPVGFIFQIVHIQPDFNAGEHLFHHSGITSDWDALIAGGEVIVVVGIAYRQAADDKRWQFPAGATPLLFRVALDKLFVDVRSHQGDGLLL